MDKIKNNFKEIREIYGATQDEIAKIIGVNRATISQWETGSIRASNTNLEKLSIFYGVGADAFYDIDEINAERRSLIMDTAKFAKEIELKSKGQRNKVNDFKEMFENISFEETRSKFMFAMKMLLASADHAETVEDLKVAYDINQKMARRLEAFIKIREDEEKAKKEKNEDTLFDLLDKFSEE